VFLGIVFPSSGILATPAAAVPAPAPPPPTELLVNGSFESGDFTGWGTRDMADPFAELGVYAAGAALPMMTVAPTDGVFAVGHGFDGGGPDTIEFWQEVAIPAGFSADLSFDWSASTTHRGLPRTFAVVVEPSGGGTALMTAPIYATTPDEDPGRDLEPFAIETSLPSDATIAGETGPMSATVDVSAFAGSTVRINFVATIPEVYTGPGSMQVDNVSLLASDSEAPLIALIGDDPQVVEVGSPYVEFGASVSDNYDTGLVVAIDATSVDTSVEGVYEVLYDAVDAAGNKAVQVARSVEVVDTTVAPIDFFIDDDDSVFEGDINWLAAEGITYGCNAPVNDRFCPDGIATRGQVAAFLHRALPDLPEVRAAIDFADDNGSTFEADIEWMYSRGITQGTSATTFSPTSAVTRGQMAAFLHRALPDLAAERAAIDFTDDDDSIFEADIEWMYSRGITQGTSATTFNPAGSVTRGQMAAFLHRALGS
jgi:hypothetical protein